ncbi:MAG: glycoside hydrolase family 5 protein, partial [Oscillospiraceae bacterium]
MKKLLKKIVCCALSAATMLTMSVSASISSFASDKLTGLTADQIVDEMTVGWNLGNSLDSISQNGSPSPQESVTAWGNPEPTQELIKKVKETGFNTIRIPITWYQHLTYDSSADKYIVKSDWMQYVKKVVDWAYNMDMFVIINVHHEDWVNVSHFTEDTLNTAKKKLGDIWSQVAEEFKDYDQHLIFEGMNEPRETYDSSVEWGDGNSNSWSYINTLNSVFVSTIRNNGEGNNPERLLMIPAYHASDSAVPLNNLTIPDNAGNIALSVHAYEPYSFTMDTSESHIYESTNKWGTYNPDTVASVMHSLKNISESKNVPIILGEFSASDFNNTAERVKWAKDYVSQATQNGFVCVLWDNNCTYSGSDNSENHGYFNRADNSIYANSKDVLEAIIEAAGQEYTEPEPDEFWNTVTMGDNWVKLEKFDNGVSVSQYSGYKLSADMSYIKEGYKLAIVHNGSTAPKLVLETNDGKYTWIQVDAESTENHISYYNYNDIMTALNNSGYTISQIGNIIGQVMVESKVYGLYAVPVSSDSSSVSDSSSKADSSSKVESSSQAESS